jgi:fumarate reductase iron-sulfur subunit
MPEPMITLRVTRFRPSEDRKPVERAYEVPMRRDWVVLDALNHIKDHLDGSLSFRWSCRMGVCGSCGMMVNGEPKLTCSVFLRDYHPQSIRVQPLVNFPVLRDLVVDISAFLDKLQAVQPWIIRDREAPVTDGEYPQTPEQLAAYKSFTACINCMLCYSACPIFGLETDFIGPAALALAYRYNQDSRDEGTRARWNVINDHQGAWQCTFVGECSVVCPKDVDPAAAIQRLKVDTAKRWVRSVLLPWGRQ